MIIKLALRETIGFFDALVGQNLIVLSAPAGAFLWKQN